MASALHLCSQRLTHGNKLALREVQMPRRIDDNGLTAEKRADVDMVDVPHEVACPVLPELAPHANEKSVIEFIAEGQVAHHDKATRLGDAHELDEGSLNGSWGSKDLKYGVDYDDVKFSIARGDGFGRTDDELHVRRAPEEGDQLGDRVRARIPSTAAAHSMSNDSKEGAVSGPHVQDTSTRL